MGTKKEPGAEVGLGGPGQWGTRVPDAQLCSGVGKP